MCLFFVHNSAYGAFPVNNGEIMNAYRPCPVCKKNEVELLYTIKYPAEKDRILPVEYQIVSCFHCGMVFDTFDADESVFFRHYQNDGKYEMKTSYGAGGNNPSDLSRWEKITSSIEQFIKDKEASIIDIGAGKGGLLSYLRDKGYTKLTGVDSSSNCVKYICDNHKIKAICADFNKLLLNEKYDLVILAQTLEHMYFCNDCLANIRNIMTDDGFLYLEVPDASRYLDCKHLPFYYFDHEHINHFQKVSLENLLYINGFKIIFCDQFEIENVPGFITPHLAAIAKKTDEIYNCITARNDDTTVKNYIKESNIQDKQLRRYDSGKKNGFIWGVGALCQRLLKNDFFINCKISGLIDADTKKQGNQINGQTIYPPDILSGIDTENTFVIITTALYEQEIREQLKMLNFKGDIVTLND